MNIAHIMNGWYSNTLKAQAIDATRARVLIITFLVSLKLNLDTPYRNIELALAGGYALSV